MPRKTDLKPIQCNFLDRRFKLLPCQRERMKWLYENSNMSYNQLAKKYGVSKRLIILCVNPESAEKVKAQYAEKQRDGRYYNREKHTIAIREHRQYKKEIFTT